MKILHVIPYFAPAWAYGGTPRAAYEIAKRQAALGHSVTVLTTVAFEKDQTLPGSEIIEGIHVCRLPLLSNWLTWHYHFAIPKLFKFPFSGITFDVLHLHEVRTPLNLIASLLINRKKTVLHSWGTLPFNERFAFIKASIDLLFKQLVYNNVQISFAQNNHEYQVLKKFHLGKKIIILPLGINTPKINLTKFQARNKLNLTNSFTFVYLGRFSPVKGIEVLIKAFQNLSYKHNCNLVLVGRDDGYKIQILELIRNLKMESKVKVLPPLYGIDRYIAYRAADCFVSVPTVYEETSTTCLEALTAKVPVITSTLSEIPFLSKTDGVSHIIPEVNELISSMRAHLNSRVKVNNKKVNALFNWDRIVERLIGIYVN